MRLFLDDVRQPSFVGWSGDDIIVCRTTTQAIAAFERGDIDIMSLDHDLGGLVDDRGADGLSGYDFVLYLEERAHDGTLTDIPQWNVHSQNPEGAQRMKAALVSAERFIARRRTP